jgi:uncharacterized SAM-binding protein YcdF (DUF218 family)
VAVAGILGGAVALRLLRRVLRIVVLLVVASAVYLAVTGVQVWLTSRHDDPHPAQAIVVMGAAQYNGVPSPDLRARLSTALQAWRQGLAPLVVLTGSKEPGDAYTESQAGAMWLQAQGVPSSDIVEVGGRDSYANLSQAASILVPEHRTEVLVVTDGFHEDRSMAIATGVGLTPSPVPATASPITGWASVPYFAKETVGVAVGRIIGYQRLDLFDHL